MSDSGGRMVSSTVPAAVLKLGAMLSISSPRTMTSAPAPRPLNQQQYRIPRLTDVAFIDAEFAEN